MHRLVRWMPVISIMCAPMLVVLLLGGCREDLIDATPAATDAEPSVADTTVDLQQGESPALDEPVVEDAEGLQQDEQASPDADGIDSTAPMRSQDTGSARGQAQGASESAPQTSSGEVKPSGAEPTSPVAPPSVRRNAGGAARGGFESANPRQTGPRPPAGDGERADRGDRGAGLFERQDANGDGLLSRSEIPEEFRERIMAADANGDGAVSREELRQAMVRGTRRPGGEDTSPEERRARMMERLDANGDGKLQLSELPERMRERMAQADVNHDGVLSDEEMEALGESWRERRGDGSGGFGGRPRRGGEQD